MKARVKATGKITEVKYSRQVGPDAIYRDLVTGEHYMDFELSFLPEDGTPDYWTRLEHQYAVIFTKSFLDNCDTSVDPEQIIDDAINMATSLVIKLKLKEEEK